MRRVLAAIIAMGVIGVTITLLALEFWPENSAPIKSAKHEDTRLSFQSPYLNTNPAVQYVGDAKCAECHGKITNQYSKHPMHLTLAPASADAPSEAYKPEALKPFSAGGLTYTVERRGDKVFHTQSLRNPEGGIRTTFETEVDYVVGAGAIGSAFLYERDGYVMQSPIGWRSEKIGWALSPGYEKVVVTFQRPIGRECLFCHGNYSEPVPNTTNRFKMPLAPRGYGVGCERCHGPGELHVRYEQEGGMEPAPGTKTIVNPMDPEMAGHLREAVCEQCHLEGVRRVLRRGRDFFDYRPGLPLHLFWSVFLNASESDQYLVVGQVEQMHESRCYKESRGKLSCISCHDPHSVPEPEEKVRFYRDRCLTCHTNQGCSLAEANRRKVNKDDSCIGCHMPSVASTEHVHIAVTDHRVPRKSSPAGLPPKRGLDKPVRNPLHYFHTSLVRQPDPELDRDLGIALAGRLVSENLAKDLLEQATWSHPDDLASWIALGFDYAVRQRHGQALFAYEKALSLAHDHEAALVGAAEQAAASGNLDKAVDYFSRASAANPYNAHCHENLAWCFARQENWEKATQESRAALKLNIFSAAYRVLIESLVRQGRTAEARNELEFFSKLRPDQSQQLRKWHSELKQ